MKESVCVCVYMYVCGVCRFEPRLIPLCFALLFPQICPAQFTVAAGGPCANLVSPPPLGCSNNFHNGDVDDDGDLTVDDLDLIANYIIDAVEFTDCQIFVADGKSKRRCATNREGGVAISLVNSLVAIDPTQTALARSHSLCGFLDRATQAFPTDW